MKFVEAFRRAVEGADTVATLDAETGTFLVPTQVEATAKEGG